MLDKKKIEQRRRKLGLSQEQAAGLAGLAGRQAWNNIVSGGKDNVKLDTLQRIATALDCDPRELLNVQPVQKRLRD